VTIIVSIEAGGNVLDELERAAITQVLADCEGNIAKTAKLLGIKRQSLQRKMTRLGLRPPIHVEPFDSRVTGHTCGCPMFSLQGGACTCPPET
jgi:hypothetical protein